MIHFLFENSELKNRKFPIPNGIKKHLYSTLKEYNGDKTVDGYKRLKNILSMDGIKYNEMKRIKNFFDHYNGTKKSNEYILNGGEEMQLWVNNTLSSATKIIKDFKQAKKDSGINNAFIKNHEKDRLHKNVKPTVSKVNTNELGKNILNNNDIKYESKTIVISTPQYKMLLEAKDDSFSIKELESLKSFNKRYQYCVKHLGKTIGKGSSRAVFQIDDNKVLKLAFNKKGIAQNSVENNQYLINLGISTKIFYSNYDDTLLISEYALPAKKEDFIKCEDVSWDEFVNFIRADNAFRYSQNIKDGYNYIDKERYEYLCENNYLCNMFSTYIGDCNPPIGDLLRIDSYGLVNRENLPSIVLLDSGLNDDVLKMYH